MFKKILTKKRISIILVLLVIGLGYFNYAKTKNVVEVNKVELENIKVRKTISGSGVVTSKNDSNLSFTSVGKIQKVYVEKGDTVINGQLLAQLNNTSVLEALQATKDARDIALRDLDLYIENYATNVDAVGGQDEYNINIRRLQELVSKAEATYQSQLASSNDTYLYAPFSGTIVDVLLEEGETTGIGTTVIKIADLNSLTFEVNIDQEDYGYIKLGLPVEVTLDSYDGDIFNGKVSELPKYVNDLTNEDFLVDIDISSNDENKPTLLGMKGDASIIVDETKNIVQALIFDSIYSDDTGSFVWVDENSMVNKKYIDIGLEGDVYTEIKTDLLSDIVISTAKSDTTFEIGQKIKYSQKK